MTKINFVQTASTKSWGGDSSARYSTRNLLQIGKRKWSDIAIMEDLLSGRPNDGKFGPGLFKDQIASIDFDKHLISIYQGMPDFHKDHASLTISLRQRPTFTET